MLEWSTLVSSPAKRGNCCKGSLQDTLFTTVTYQEILVCNHSFFT